MSPAWRDVVVTGLGAVSALAGDAPGLWEAVAAGRGGIGPIRRFPTQDFHVHTGAVVEEDFGPPSGPAPSNFARCRRFAMAAAREALRSAGPDAAPAMPSRLALVFGTGLGDLETPIHTLAVEIAAGIGAGGPCLTVSTACSSSTGALAVARDLLSLDAADAVLAGGADVLSPEVFAGFHALGVLSAASCAPFSHPFGTTLGEGAGFMLLERSERARRRGATVVTTVAGCGLSGDAFHETSPEPRGAGVERAIRAAMRDAALAPDEIGYVNAHGSGTEANDPAEWSGIQRALGAHARHIPVSSTKGALGHAQGAAGVLEAIVTVQAMAHDMVPPTLNFTSPRPQAPDDPVPGPRPRPGVVRHALALNAAFGGANAAVVLSRGSAGPPPRRRRPVRALGVGLVGPWGAGPEAYRRRPPGDGTAAPFDLAPLVPQADPRCLDPMSRYLTAAAALALQDGGVALRGSLRDRAGLVVGQLGASPTSHRDFRRSIAEHGLAHLSATAFARIVLNAAAGTCSKLLALRGPLTAVTTGPGSGLIALVLAAELLATRDDTDLMVAGGADEAGAEGEGAACVLLGAGTFGDGAPDGAIHLRGWALAGPGRAEEAERDALRAAGMDGADERRVVPEHAGAMPSAQAVADAVLALRDGTAATALVTCAVGEAASAALLLGRG